MDDELIDWYVKFRTGDDQSINGTILRFSFKSTKRGLKNNLTEKICDLLRINNIQQNFVVLKVRKVYT